MVSNRGKDDDNHNYYCNNFYLKNYKKHSKVLNLLEVNLVFHLCNVDGIIHIHILVIINYFLRNRIIIGAEGGRKDQFRIF